MITLDAAISSCGVDRIDWLKIDVEGFEVEVLRGAEEALSFVRKMVIEVEDANVAECYRLLVDRLGFKIVDCVPGTEYTYWFLQGKRP